MLPVSVAVVSWTVCGRSSRHDRHRHRFGEPIDEIAKLEGKENAGVDVHLAARRDHKVVPGLEPALRRRTAFKLRR